MAFPQHWISVSRVFLLKRLCLQSDRIVAFQMVLPVLQAPINTVTCFPQWVFRTNGSKVQSELAGIQISMTVNFFLSSLGFWTLCVISLLNSFSATKDTTIYEFFISASINLQCYIMDDCSIRSQGRVDLSINTGMGYRPVDSLYSDSSFRSFN